PVSLLKLANLTRLTSFHQRPPTLTPPFPHGSLHRTHHPPQPPLRSAAVWRQQGLRETLVSARPARSQAPPQTLRIRRRSERKAEAPLHLRPARAPAPSHLRHRQARAWRHRRAFPPSA